MDNVTSPIKKWITQSVWKNAEILNVRPLKGGTSSTVLLIRLIVAGKEKEAVLRIFDNEEWRKEEPDLAMHEAESLRFAANVAIRTPELISVDPEGEECGFPAVVMTKLPGAVILKPNDMTAWIEGMAESLAFIHQYDGDFPWSYQAYTDVSLLTTPLWTKYSEYWEDSLHYLKKSHPAANISFIHRDFHPANVLWTGDQVSGIVDWVNACRGPKGVDVGHCRFNLAMLHGVECADLFLKKYQMKAVDFQYDPYWDILSLVDILTGPPNVYEGWKAFGITHLTDQMMVERLDEYLFSLWKKIQNLS